MATLKFSEEAARRLEILYSSPDVRGQREAALRYLNLQAGETVLDIGCGPGYLTEMMADAVTETGSVLGIDISEDLLHVARRRNSRGWQTYRAGDAMALDVPNECADVAISMQVLEYLPDIDRAIGEISRVLKSTGRALIVATDWDGVVWHSAAPERMRRVLRAWEEHCADPRLPRTLVPRLKAAGLHPVAVLGHPLINLRLGEDTYSDGIARLAIEFISQRNLIPADQLNAWHEELRALSDEGRYFFGTMRYLFLAAKHAPA
jgi:SAM-dependent methyltransferase